MSADEPSTLLQMGDKSPITPINEEPATPEPKPAESEPTPPEPAQTGEGSSPPEPKPEDPPKADDPPKPEPTARERLIAKLTGAEDDEEPTNVDADPAPETPPKAEAPETPPAPEPEKSDDEELTELTNDTASKLKPGDYRRKVNKLISRVKQAEPLAAVGKEIIELCEANKLAPPDYKAWVEVGIGLQNGDPQALAMLKNVATKAGIMPTSVPATMSPELDAWLTTQEKALEIAPSVAAELRKRLGPPAAPPAPPTAPTPQPPPTQRQQAPPAANPYVQAQTRAVKEIDRIADEYIAKLGDARFAELEPKIMVALKARKGKHPDAWPDIFRAVVAEELAKAPKLATPGQPLRPGSTPSSATPQFKTERERLIHKYSA